MMNTGLGRVCPQRHSSPEESRDDRGFYFDRLEFLNSPCRHIVHFPLFIYTFPLYKL